MAWAGARARSDRAGPRRRARPAALAGHVSVGRSVPDDVNRPPDHLGADLDRLIAGGEGGGRRGIASQRVGDQTASGDGRESGHDSGVDPAHGQASGVGEPQPL